MAGDIGQLRYFDYYIARDPQCDDFNINTDSFYTAFPASENLTDYSLYQADFFALFNTSSPAGVPNSATIVAVYRFVNAGIRDHIYTANQGEIGILDSSSNWTNEGIVGYAYSASIFQLNQAIYRWTSSDFSHTNHALNTTSAGVSPSSLCGDYINEGASFFAPIVDTASPTTASIQINGSGSNQTLCPGSVAGTTVPFTLSWSTSNATSVTVTDPYGNVISNSLNDNGTQENLVGTYTISASGSLGNATDTITVGAFSPISVAFSGSVATIQKGQNILLSWSKSGSYTSISINNGIGTVTNDSSIIVSPITTTTYTITATGPCETVTDNFTVNVVQPVTASIQINGSGANQTLCPGGFAGTTVPFTLSWTTTDATSVTVTDPSGNVISNSPNNNGTQENFVGTYTISASNGVINVTDTITTSTYNLVSGGFIGSGVTINRGQSTDLRWSKGGSNPTVIIDNGIGNVTSDSDNTRTVTPSLTTTYTITVSGPCNSVTGTYTVTVLQPGCTDPAASNYNSSAGYNDGSCVYGGLTDLGSLRLFDEFFGVGLVNGVNYDDSFYTAYPNGEVGDLLEKYSRNVEDLWNLFSTSNAKGAVGTIVPVYRLYNNLNINHFYTISESEKNNLTNTNGWIYEGIIGYAYSADGPNRIPVYRFYSSTRTDHAYKISNGALLGYGLESVAWYSPIVVTGCGDPTARNYDPYVNQDNTGCDYDVLGCTDSEADNYNPLATVDNGSCVFSGCTDSQADNYWSKANNNDGSCIFTGCTDPLANNYWTKANNDDGSCTYDPPTITLTLDKTTLISGDSLRLTWTASGPGLSSATLTDVNNPAFGGNATIYPTQTTTYTYSVTGLGGTTTVQKTITVYQVPELFLSSNPGTSIIAGNSVTVSWYITGDADTLVWTQGGISNTNLTSQQSVSPTQTTVYSGYPTGLGGRGTTKSITIVVYQIPTLTVNYPVSINYGDQAQITYTARYVNSSLSITPTYYYLDGSSITGNTVNLDKPNSAEFGVGLTEVTGSYTTTVPYNNLGPLSIVYTIVGSGNGGSVTSTQTIPINVDITPENLDIIDNDGLIADQDPVSSPESIDILDHYLINDIDIDVEIKADYPIEINVNNTGIWKKVREL